LFSTAQTKKADQLPGYSGHVGGQNLHLLENGDEVHEKFVPTAVLRTRQPKEPAPNLLDFQPFISRKYRLKVFNFD
jgi:hypothetical protein